MKNKRGFTLVELLAVVVVLGIIGSIVTMSVMNIKKNASDDVFEKLQKEIEDLGPEIYTHEMISGDKVAPNSFYNMYKNEGEFIITVEELQNKGYLDSIQSPYKTSETCKGYLKVDTTSGEPEFSAFLNCSERKTSGYDDNYEVSSNKAVITG